MSVELNIDNKVSNQDVNVTNNIIENNVIDNNVTIIKNKLSRIYGGTINVPTLYSSIDILSNDLIIVIKSLNNWAEGIGLLYSHSIQFPNKLKHLHIYNVNVNLTKLNKIISLTNELNIKLTIEN